MTDNTLVRRTLVLALTALLIVGAAAPGLAQYLGRGRVLAFHTDTWRIFTPAGRTQVVVDGDGDTDLDCWVFDRNGTLLGQDVDRTDLCIINFRHRSDGDLTIRVQNLGSVYNDYVLTVD